MNGIEALFEAAQMLNANKQYLGGGDTSEAHFAIRCRDHWVAVASEAELAQKQYSALYEGLCEILNKLRDNEGGHFHTMGEVESALGEVVQRCQELWSV